MFTGTTLGIQIHEAVPESTATATAVTCSKCTCRSTEIQVFPACKCLMGTRMLLYCSFETHINSVYLTENQQKKDMAKPQANNIY